MKKVVWIKKSQIDSTAALTYGLGVSFIHLGLFVLACTFERPNLDLQEARSYKECTDEAERYDYIIRLFIGMHIICFIATVFREFFPAEIGLLGRMMHLVEVFCVPLYLYCLVCAHEMLALILIRNEAGPEKGVFQAPDPTEECRSLKQTPTRFLCDKCPRNVSEVFSGRVLEFFFIEIIVYTFYLCSMVIYMIKSRCQKVGNDIG